MSLLTLANLNSASRFNGIWTDALDFMAPKPIANHPYFSSNPALAPLIPIFEDVTSKFVKFIRINLDVHIFNYNGIINQVVAELGDGSAAAATFAAAAATEEEEAAVSTGMEAATTMAVDGDAAVEEEAYDAALV